MKNFTMLLNAGAAGLTLTAIALDAVLGGIATAFSLAVHSITAWRTRNG